MQRVAVEFGRATFSHNTANIELHARATASLQTTFPHLCQQAWIDADALLLEDLWVRPRHPLRVSFALTGPSQLARDFQYASTSNEGLLSTLSSATLWSQLGFDAVNADCTQASGSDADPDASSRIEIHLERTRTRDNHGQCRASDTMEHDSDEINCPSSMSTARLTEVWLQLDFQPSDQHESTSPRARHAALVAMVDAALRNLICHSRPRLVPGVRRRLPFASNLQDTFPAIFSPGRSKGVSDRLRLISSISRSIVNCRRRSNKYGATSVGSRLNGVQGDTPLEGDGYRHQIETLEKSLFMSLVHNIEHGKGAKILKSFAVSDWREDPSMPLSDLPEVTEDLSMFDTSIEQADASSISLFFEDDDERDRDRELFSHRRSWQTASQFSRVVTDEPTEIIRTSQSFEDLTFAKPCNGRLPEDYDSKVASADRSCSEATFDFCTSAYFAEKQPISELDEDVSMLREPIALAEEAGAPFSSHSSARSDVIGGDDKLTQSCIRKRPPDDCSIRSTSPQTEELPHVVTASIIHQGDKARIENFIDDLFTFDFCQASQRSLRAKSPFVGDILEVFDDNSSTSSSDNLELECLSQEPQNPMNNSREEELTLAELLGDAKFSPEMWIRRRSTVMHSIPSTYVPGPTTRTLGTGWSLKSRPREIKEAPSHPATARTRESRQPSVVEGERRPIFSKRLSTSSSSSSPPESPTEAKPHRRDSLLRRWSRGSKTPSDQEMLDFDLGQIDKRAVEVKRRKTIEDYDMQGAVTGREDEDDMLFA